MRPICVDNVIDCFASETEDLQGEMGGGGVSALPDGREQGVTAFTAGPFPGHIHPIQGKVFLPGVSQAPLEGL